ncbi:MULTISPECIES: FUSC family protein [unclassified Caballeronia]|uniref:FUSC family protein n=1 Tax=unclassified Caballeronia TaxID=2646786 RepID=UPI0028630982|nr:MULTISPECIES: FUSC family protein [unclassified Caballeronia]MDR5754548.1 FUSC family protein [Caballeronia sp. LZ024]MDR5839519.1 FUSC family protein [Caballeronia sp. LZ031]
MNARPPDPRPSPFATLIRITRDAATALGRELAAWKPSSERAGFAAQAMASVALAVALARAFDLSNTWWAAISGFAVMQTSFAASARRGLHRMLGTVLGGLLGALAGPALGGLPWLFVPAMGAIGGVAVYRALASEFSYAWVLGGATALMVIFEAHTLPTFAATASFATLRVSEVFVGTLACVAVSGVFHAGERQYRRYRPLAAVEALAATVAQPSPKSIRAARKLLAWQGAVSIAILAALIYILKLPGFAQAMVTAMAVLILPAASLAGHTRRPVAERMVQRFAGCLLAGLIGVALLPLLGDHAWLSMIALSAGVWSGCHVQTGKEGASYVGRQFTIAFIMVFVQDHRWSANPLPALMRLSGILTGVVVLAAVMLAMSRLPLARESSDAL